MTQSELKELKAIGAELGAAKAEVEEVVVVYDPDSRSYEEHTLSVSDTKGSRKSLGIQNAKLKSKIGRLCIQNNELRKELDKHSSDLEAAYKAGLSARGFAGIPKDWSVTKDGESILLRHKKGSAVELNSNGSLCDRVIYGFISDLLYAAPIAQTALQPEQSKPANKLRALAEIWDQNADEADEFGNAQAAEALRLAAFELRATLSAPQGKFRMGDLVKKSTGSEWHGRICGTYSTELTPEGYAVESSAHRNSVQIYPAKALEAVE